MPVHLAASWGAFQGVEGPAESALNHCLGILPRRTLPQRGSFDEAFTQSARTADYVDLFDATRKMHVRLSAGQAVWRADGSADWSPWPGSDGGWEVPGSGELEAVILQAVEEYKRQVGRISQEAKDGADQIESKAPRPSAVEGVVGYTVQVTSVDHRIQLDLPVVKVHEKNLAMHIPQVVGTDKSDIVFHTPSVRMVRKVISRYPEVSIHGVKWCEISADVPETFQQEHRIAVLYPKVSMARHDIKVNVPEVFMESRDFTFRLPSVTVKSVNAEGEKAKEDGEQLSADTNAKLDKAKAGLKQAFADKVKPAVASKFEAMRQKVNGERQTVLGQVRAAFDQTTQKMRADGVPAGDGAFARLKTEQQAAENSVNTQFDAALQQMVQAEKDALAAILNSVK